MEKINLHKIDKPEALKMFYDSIKDYFEDNISGCKRKFSYFYYTFKESTELIEMSVLEKPELSQQKYWFTYGLSCISEFCRLAHFSNEIKDAQIDESGFFPIKVESLGELQAVRKPIQLARIARDKEKEKIIANVPLDLLNLDRNLTFNHEYINILTKLEIEYSLTGNFNCEYYESLVDIYNKNQYSIQAKISSGTNQTLYYIHPYVIALKSLADDNEVEFNQNLINAIEAHKEVWS